MLAILTTHPIQYQVPLWQELARRGEIPFEVWYLSDHGAKAAVDPGFGKAFGWDIDMLGGYPHAFLNMRPYVRELGDLRRAWIDSLRDRMRQRDVRMLWIQGWHVPAYWQATMAAHRAGIPVWLRGESNDLRRRQGLRGIVHPLLLRFLIERVSRFLYIGSANRDLYRRLGVPDSRLLPAPYCVDNERFSAAADDARARREALRAGWEIPSGALCVLFAGKLIPSKRPLDLFHAVERLLLERPRGADNLRILVVGDGELLPRARREAERLTEIAGKPIVRFAGFLNQTEMPAAYAAADWLVLPSDARETWGLVVNEALASGTAAVASDRCGCARDLVAPLDPRLIYPCGDVQMLSTIIGALLDGGIPSPSLARCREVVSCFDLGISVDTVTSAYRELDRGRVE